MCPKCAGSGRSPQITLSTAEKLVTAHTGHLRRADEPVRRLGLAGPSSAAS
jgi:hypothetical protein